MKIFSPEYIELFAHLPIGIIALLAQFVDVDRHYPIAICILSLGFLGFVNQLICGIIRYY